MASKRRPAISGSLPSKQKAIEPAFLDVGHITRISSGAVDPCAEEPLFEDAGNVVAGAEFTHPADCAIQWTATALPSGSTVRVLLRYVDASNYWMVRYNSLGNIDLLENVAGSLTARGSAAASVANGDDIVVVADGATIVIYVNGSEKIAYASATSHQTETDGQVFNLGTGGVISDFSVWSVGCAPLP